MDESSTGCNLQCCDRAWRLAVTPQRRVRMGVRFSDYVARWEERSPPAEAFRYGTVVEEGGRFRSSACAARARGRGDHGGFHGDEKAGPLTLLAHAAELVDYAARAASGCGIYPCINPSGFEAHTRYNMSGERPNNDFLRYEIAPGVWCGELREGETFCSVAPGPATASPRRRRRWRGSWTRPASRRARWTCTRTTSSMARCSTPTSSATAPLPAAAGAVGGAGPDPAQQPSSTPGTSPAATSAPTRRGSSSAHDGSITDRFYRAGVPYTAAIETTTETPAAPGRRDQPHLDTGLHRPGGHCLRAWRTGLGKTRALG